MTEQIHNAIDKALSDAKTQAVFTIDKNLYLPPNVAANIIEMLKRVQTTGFEAFALVEAVTYMRQVAQAPPEGPGQPFVPANQAQ